jgi:hypothetical protein
MFPTSYFKAMTKAKLQFESNTNAYIISGKFATQFYIKKNPGLKGKYINRSSNYANKTVLD